MNLVNDYTLITWDTNATRFTPHSYKMFKVNYNELIEAVNELKKCSDALCEDLKDLNAENYNLKTAFGKYDGMDAQIDDICKEIRSDQQIAKNVTDKLINTMVESLEKVCTYSNDYMVALSGVISDLKKIQNGGEPSASSQTSSSTLDNSSNITVEKVSVTNPVNASAGQTQTINKIDFNGKSIDTSKYSGTLYTKRSASADTVSTAGQVTTNNQSYSVVADSDYKGEAGTISQSDYNLLIAQVAGESANSQDDMLGVTSTILNRLESNQGMGDSVSEVLEKGYFPWGESYRSYVEGGQYYNTDWGQEKLAQVTEVVNDALAGTRNINSDVYYYGGDGTHNYFSDQC